MPSLPNIIGYSSGTLYCLVLDWLDADWKKGLRRDSDLGELLREAAGITDIKPYNEMDFESYGYSEILEKEASDAEARETMIAELTDIFTNKPTLRIHEKGQLSVSGQKITLPGFGLVLQGYVEYIGKFGRLFVKDGVLLAHDDGYRVIPFDEIEIDGNRVTGKDWELELYEGFELKRDGSGYVI